MSKSRNTQRTWFSILGVSSSLLVGCANDADRCEQNGTCIRPNDAGAAGRIATTSGETSSKGGTSATAAASTASGGTAGNGFGSVSAGRSSAVGFGGAGGAGTLPSSAGGFVQSGGSVSGAGTAERSGGSTSAGTGVAGTITSSVPCNGACKPPTPICSPTTNVCVECTSNGDCAGIAGKPLCDPQSNTCVACLQKTDCKDTAKPFCSASKTCVGCLTNGDCNDPKASRCDAPTNTCTFCNVDNDCSQIAGKTVCLTGASGQPNQCVQCTGKKYAACGKSGDGKALVCDSLTHACSATATAQSVYDCAPCISDAQCMPGRYCLQHAFGGQSLGYYCFWKEGDLSGGAPAVCGSNSRPYFDGSGTTSIDGDAGTYCTLAKTTCKALNEFRTASCTSDSQCGMGIGVDSKCLETRPGSGEFRCTVACTSNDDCPIGYACEGGATKFCSLTTTTGTGGSPGAGGTSSTGNAGAAGR